MGSSYVECRMGMITQLPSTGVVRVRGASEMNELDLAWRVMPAVWAQLLPTKTLSSSPVSGWNLFLDYLLCCHSWGIWGHGSAKSLLFHIKSVQGPGIKSNPVSTLCAHVAGTLLYAPSAGCIWVEKVMCMATPTSRAVKPPSKVKKSQKSPLRPPS